MFTKEVWLAAIEGTDFPPEQADDPATLLERHDAAAPRWLAAVRDIDSSGAWDDRLIDALCDPPESFVISSVVAHVLTYAATDASWCASSSAVPATRSTAATRSTGSARAMGEDRGDA